jgi:hypothetical protein
MTKIVIGELDADVLVEIVSAENLPAVGVGTERLEISRTYLKIDFILRGSVFSTA